MAARCRPLPPAPPLPSGQGLLPPSTVCHQLTAGHTSLKQNKSQPETRKSFLRTYALPLRLILLFFLLAWLMYVMADSYGIEGEAGWLGEILGTFLFILGIIVAAGAMVGAVKIIRGMTGDDKNATRPWGDSGGDSGGDSRQALKPGSAADDAADAADADAADTDDRE